VDKDLIDKAVNALTLEDIHLYSTSVHRFEFITDRNYPEDMAQQNKLKISVDIIELENSEEDQDLTRQINAKVTFGTRYVIPANEENDSEDSTEDTVLAEIEACFLAVYTQRGELNDEPLKEFMQYNMVHNVWPFWREYAFNISSKSELPKPMIPLFKK
jgi:hypothetical protein